MCAVRSKLLYFTAHFDLFSRNFELASDFEYGRFTHVRVGVRVKEELRYIIGPIPEKRLI